MVPKMSNQEFASLLEQLADAITKGEWGIHDHVDGEHTVITIPGQEMVFMARGDAAFLVGMRDLIPEITARLRAHSVQIDSSTLTRASVSGDSTAKGIFSLIEKLIDKLPNSV